MSQQPFASQQKKFTHTLEINRREKKTEIEVVEEGTITNSTI